MSSGRDQVGQALLRTPRLDQALVLEPELALAFGEHHARRDRVDPDAIFPDGAGERAGKADDRRLGGGIGLELRNAPHPRDRGHVDDRAIAEFAHLRHDRLRGKENMTEIDRHRAVELGRGHRREVVALVVGSVVDQDGGRAERRPRLIEGAAQSLYVSQIARQEQRLFPTATCCLGQRCPGIRLDVEKRDAGAVFGESADKGAADAPAAAGHHDRAPLEAVVAGEAHTTLTSGRDTDAECGGCPGRGPRACPRLRRRAGSARRRGRRSVR